MTAQFRPIERVDGYLPIADHGLIGDGETAALVARDGTIAWLCVPRFDDPPLFAGLLDRQRGGRFTIVPEDLAASRQRYLGDTGILVTELADVHGGIVRIIDTMTLRSGADLTEDVPAARGELVRTAEVLEGRVRLRVELEPHGGAEVDRRGDGLRVRCRTRPDLALQLDADFPLDKPRVGVALRQGDRVHVVLRWGGTVGRRAQGEDPDALHRATLDAWERWNGNILYEGPQAALVRRSAVTLKLLDRFENGAMVAAPTSSLPEALGGVRNWDYRYAWIRDAAFSVYAMSRIGLEHESAGFLAWVLDVVERGGHPRVLYTLDGLQAPAEREDASLEGYCGSAPVRWGNAASGQRQHDVYGEILDCAYLWAKRGGTIDDSLWARLHPLVAAARGAWDAPDQGIWEVRSPPRPFTYSAAMCQVAVDRGARIAGALGLEGDVAGWRADAARMRDAVVEAAWNERYRAFTGHLGGDALDASVLALPLRRLLDADHPRMRSTAAAIAEHLSAGRGLLYRYLPHESPDGLPGGEGAFLLCSFWLVDNLTLQGRLDDALDLYQALCAHANALGLLPEQIDPASGAFLGNFPQGLSHVGLITSGVSLAYAMARRGGAGTPLAAPRPARR
ncbi:MAG: glycoside hydrolase family 15 protein [Burkholderiales bacterium]|nr:glycoside hydrolase family 15 protein [Burkholderiales bacterium]